MAATPVMIQAAEDYVKACPTTPIVFLGYSVGGIAVMNTLCGGIPNIRRNVLTSIVYGDETYVGGKFYDRGTCTNNAVSSRTRTDSVSA